jgi:uncharacterized membrane protein YfcA
LTNRPCIIKTTVKIGNSYHIGYCLSRSHSDILSGFGLGTILTPIFMLFFPIDLAIGLTGIVHLCNNLFKLLLVGRQADKQVLIRFGIPAIIAALLGSWLLLNITDPQTALCISNVWTDV